MPIFPVLLQCFYGWIFQKYWFFKMNLFSALSYHFLTVFFYFFYLFFLNYMTATSLGTLNYKAKWMTSKLNTGKPTVNHRAVPIWVSIGGPRVVTFLLDSIKIKSGIFLVFSRGRGFSERDFMWFFWQNWGKKWRWMKSTSKKFEFDSRRNATKRQKSEKN